jgi:hypothetical protein
MQLMNKKFKFKSEIVAGINPSFYEGANIPWIKLVKDRESLLYPIQNYLISKLNSKYIESDVSQPLTQEVTPFTGRI